MQMHEPGAEFAFTTETASETTDYLAAHLAERLGSVAQGDWLTLANLTGLLARVEDTAPKSPDRAPALIRRWRWVVRTEDLKMFDSTFDSAVAAVPLGLWLTATAPAALPWAALVGAVAHVCKLARRAH